MMTFSTLLKKAGSTLFNRRTMSVFGVSALAVLVLHVPDALAAEGDKKFVGVLCNVLDLLQGNVARSVAAAGIIFLGFSLFLGKVSWGTALAIGIGIGAIFGAKDIVDLLAGDGLVDACSTTITPDEDEDKG
jgi:type IV secretion system protein VirB2